MANEFTKLTEKEVVESVSENGHLFAEDGGKIVRVPAAGVGGSGVTVYYIEPTFAKTGYLYADALCTKKITKNELIASAESSAIVLVRENEYQKTWIYPIYISTVEDYCELNFTFFDEASTAYTAEWTESAGPQ